MGFSRQEYWSGLPFPSPRDLPNPGIEPRSPALEADTLTSEPPGKPNKTGALFSEEQRSLECCSPWGHKESDTTWWLNNNKCSHRINGTTDYWLSMGFPGDSEVKASASNVGDLGSIPGSGSSPGEGNGNPLQYSCLENPMDEEPGRLHSKGSQRVSDWGLHFISIVCLHNK